MSHHLSRMLLWSSMLWPTGWLTHHYPFYSISPTLTSDLLLFSPESIVSFPCFKIYTFNDVVCIIDLLLLCLEFDPSLGSLVVFRIG